ncbi:MAG: hypothetical protein C7B46_18645 [Sulfobacillus benefaciens]|uniref:Uncharacterized protein n=1 Tax=Sulfobacillus benefaciens TaxID=453960 RepID=A0A2T2X4K2_9FIRM|nr:MAG: hypothetical protein C7B46_18645 [Sulfobacillus benefaciens]
MPISISANTTPVRTLSPYNPVVAQALEWVKSRMTQALGAAGHGAYLAATALTSAAGWAIFLHGTARPYDVNNPAINQSSTSHPLVSFGRQAMTRIARSTAGQL